MKNTIYSAIESECHDQQFDVNRLIQGLKVSNAHLWELCRAYYGLAPRELIESVRLDKAITYIGNGEHIISICTQCGFGSLKTFKRAFEKRIGNALLEAQHRLNECNDKETLKFQWRNKIWRGKIPTVNQSQN